MNEAFKYLYVFLIIFCVACSSTPLRFAAIGDTPYYESESQAVEEVLHDIYKEDLPFVVHVGDIFKGNTTCSDKHYSFRAEIFSQSPIPFLITIGDNEFNDCKNPLKARDQFRKIILKNPPLRQTMTGTAPKSKVLEVTRQNGMIENVTWHYGNVKFIMLTLPDLPGEYRLEPSVINDMFDLNVKYLIDNFTQAKTEYRSAVVLIMHSDPIKCQLKACSRFTAKIKEQVKLFDKPVLYLNGSIHDQEFEGPGYMGLSNLWHIRPGSEPEISWPEIIFSTQKNLFSVKWH